MVSFWDHMKSVLKTIKKKTCSCPGKWRDPSQEPSSVCHIAAERHGLAPMPSLAPLLGGWWGQVQHPVTLSSVSSNFPFAFSVCWGELGAPRLEHRWVDLLLWHGLPLSQAGWNSLVFLKVVLIEVGGGTLTFIKFLLCVRHCTGYFYIYC